MNFTNTEYYDILGVTQSASLDNINRAKDRLKFGNPDDRAPFSQWALIDEAYSVLSNPESRKEYDEFLRANGVVVSEARTYNEFLEEQSRLTQESLENATAQLEELEVEAPAEVVEEPIDGQEIPTPDDEAPAEVVEEPVEDQESPTLDDEAPAEVVEEPVEEQKKPTLDAADPIEEQHEQTDPTYIPPFTEVNESFRQKSFEYKLKTIAKAAGVSLLITPYFALPLAILTPKAKAKFKLKREAKAKKITGIKLEELEAFKEYEKNLNIEIDKLLSEPHNNYALEINRTKYEQRIELLKRVLEIRTNRKVKNRFDALRKKLEIIDIVKQLESSKKRLYNINDEIQNYNSSYKPRLARLNDALIKQNVKIAEMQQKNASEFRIKRLKARKSRLLKKRNEKGTAIKKRVMRRSEFYDKIVKAKSFVVSRPYVFATTEKIEEQVQNAGGRTI